MAAPSDLLRERGLPPRWLPLLYFGFAHLCLAAAFAAVALDPRGLDKIFHFLPGYVLANVAAHAHLAALAWTLGLWSAGVPLLAAGLAFDRIGWLAAAGWLLLAAVVLNGIGAVRIVRHARGLTV